MPNDVKLRHEGERSTGRPMSDAAKQLVYQGGLNRNLGILLHAVFFLIVLARALSTRFMTANNLVFRLKPQRYPVKHLQPGKLFGRYHVTIPAFTQLLATIAYTAFVAALTCMGYGLRGGQSDYQPTTVMFVRWLALRMGVITFAQIPLLVLTSGSMSLLVNLTRWSRDSWNIVHRAIGRLTALTAVGHAIFYSAYAVMNGHFWRNMHRMYFLFGFGSLFLMLILSTIPSMRHSRHWSYEIFLAVHISVSLMLLLALFYHTLWRRANEWLYLTIVYWTTDRVVRSLHTASLVPLKAEITSFESVMRLDVFIPKGGIHVTPGQFAYLRFPDVRFFESHPFSIMASTVASSASITRVPEGDAEDDSDENEPLIISASEQPTDIPRSTALLPTQRLSFMIKPHDGLTKCLQSSVHGTATQETRVYLEGPYGHTYDLKPYSSVLLIAGGVGIAFVLPYHLTGQNAKLVWVVRSRGDLEGALDLLQFSEAGGEVDIFYTGPHSGDEGAMAESLTAMLACCNAIIKVAIGRPKIEEVILDLRPDVVLACGPPALLDQCRHGIESIIDRTVTYFEEASTA